MWAQHGTRIALVPSIVEHSMPVGQARRLKCLSNEMLALYVRSYHESTNYHQLCVHFALHVASLVTALC